MNKNWKKGIIALIIGIALVFAFTACGDGSGDNGNGNGTGTAPTITTTSLPNGTVGTAYSQTLAATGDTPITWSKESGDLPNGLTLSTAGVISGTPTTANTFNFTVKATNATGSGTKSLSITIASGGGGNAGTYIITGSGTSFTATKNGATVGTANQALYIIINDIQTDANGTNCTIQFGSGGSNVLDVGTSSIGFGGTWGVITITGKITSSGSGTIEINGCSLNSTADIANTRVTSSGAERGLFNHSGGTVTITSGTINCLVSNGVNGTMNINGGTFNHGIRNGGTLIINNGTIVNSSGKTIDQTGTTSLGSPVTVAVTINGGTIETTGTTSSDYAIQNKGPNTVNITGGTVKATGSAYAIDNFNGDNGEVGTVTIGAGATIIGNTRGVN